MPLRRPADPGPPRRTPAPDTPDDNGQTHTGFFMPSGFNFGAAWDELVARTVARVADGTIRIVMDQECRRFAGVDGIYEAQRRMRLGRNIGKIYARL